MLHEAGSNVVRIARKQKKLGDDYVPDGMEVLAPIGELDTDALIDLHISVIEQALSDATLGVSGQIRDGREVIRPYRVWAHAGGANITITDVHSGRRFIKGRDGMIHELLDALGIDAGFQGLILQRYAACQIYLPPEWQDTDFIKHHHQTERNGHE